MIRVFDYLTGEIIREGTLSELTDSILAAKFDGGRGVINLDGRDVYVIGDVE